MTADDRTAENRKQRLRRLDRIFVRTPIYYVTTCTDNRREILACESVHETFMGFAKEGPRHGAWVGAYVVMPDHLHAFVAFDDQKITLAQWMKSLKIRYRRRSAGMKSRRHIGRKISSITSSEAKNRTRRSGITCVSTRFGLGWSSTGKIGRIAAKSLVWNIARNLESSAVIDRRYSNHSDMKNYAQLEGTTNCAARKS